MPGGKGGPALHQLPRVGLSAGEKAAVPPPPPAVEKYRGAQVPAPLPRPRADSGPSRPSGQAPLPFGPGRVAFSLSALASGVRGAGWGWALWAARPLPSPVAARARPTSTQNEGWDGEGADSSRSSSPQKLSVHSPFPKTRPGVADKESRGAPGLPGAAPWTREFTDPAPGQRVGGQIGRQAGWRDQIGSQRGRQGEEMEPEPARGAQTWPAGSWPPQTPSTQTHWRPDGQ